MGTIPAGHRSRTHHGRRVRRRRTSATAAPRALQDAREAAIGDLAARPGFRLGWGRFPDGAEVLYLYDATDGGFGDAVNPTMPDCSEWGYAPF